MSDSEITSEYDTQEDHNEILRAIGERNQEDEEEKKPIKKQRAQVNI